MADGDDPTVSEPRRSEVGQPPMNADANRGESSASYLDVLTTKLFVPTIRQNLVSRPRLTARLDGGVTCSLILISAPPGFGKTTVLGEWLRNSKTEAGHPLAVAWFSLDDADNDPNRFLRYVAAALRAIAPSVCDAIAALVQSPQPPPLRVLLTTLLNELGTLSQECVLVLDDYHVVTAAVIHEAVAFLLDHLPPRLHVVISTREDPPLPLPRLRARGNLCELRASELRFTAEEAADFLRGVMDLQVSPTDVAALADRTEGWIAGLQLAALSMRDQADISQYIADLRGTNRYIIDYLAEEVWNRQPDAVQKFLLRTSILDRLCAPLCDAVLWEGPPDGGREERSSRSQVMLEQLERSNLFLVSLDAERQWYRYHHLFADLLRVRLRATAPGLLPELHARASAWYEQQGLTAEAIGHALAASDFSRAARLIEQHGFAIAVRGQMQTVRDWVERLPGNLVASTPSIALLRAFVLLLTNRLNAAEACLLEIERSLPAALPDQGRAIRGRVAWIRGICFRFSGDIPGSVAVCREALGLLPEHDLLPRGSAMFHVASACLSSGDATGATERLVEAAVPTLRASHNLTGLLRTIVLLARVRVLQGRLRDAAATYDEAAEVAPGRLKTLVGSPGYYVGLGDLLREWNELARAERTLTQGLELLTGMLVDPYDALFGHMALARVKQARGDADGAIRVLSAFADLAHRRNFASLLLRCVAATRAHLRLMQGNLAEAVRWTETAELCSDDQLNYAREVEYLTLARVRIAQRHPASLGLLDRLLQAAESQARRGSAIEILSLRALAAQSQRDMSEAVSAAARALVLAEPEGYVRTFVDEGAPMAALLHRARAAGVAPGYVSKLLAVFEGREATGSFDRSPAAYPAPPPVEPLTKRELEVLRLIASGASNRQIAGMLVVSVGTVKKHLYNVFAKLDVSSRTQAIAKSRMLGLL